MPPKPRVLVAVLLCLLMAASPIFARAITNDQAASTVLGQTLFTTSNASDSATGESGATGIAFDSQGNLWLADYNNNRILEYLAPFSDGEAATLVLGQPGFGSNGAGNGAAQLSEPIALAFDSSGNLWVADADNNRVVEYLKGAGFTTGEAASLVLGQTGFGLSAPGASATQEDRPYGLAFDLSGNLWVSESGNNRVIGYMKGAGFTTGEAASLVLGQAGFGTNGGSDAATGLQYPVGIVFDSQGNLWVVDQQNNRVVQFTTPFSTGEAASIVLGQAGFGTMAVATTASGMHSPSGVAIDQSGNLWVVDFLNERTLEFVKGSGFTDGESATVVLGQSSFTTSTASTTATGMDDPWQIAVDSSNNIWVGDYANNRVLEFTGNPAVGGGPTGTLVRLPDTIPQHLTFNFYQTPSIVGNLVGVTGAGVIYNVPKYSPPTDLFPNTIYECYVASNNTIRVNGFSQVTAGGNATELFVSNWDGYGFNAAGWPSEPACAA